MVIEAQSKLAFLENNSFLLWLKHKTLRFTHLLSYVLRQDENERRMALDKSNPFEECQDWHELKKVTDAGQIRKGLLVMHNGLKVLPTAYQGYGHGKLMQRALGIHEPQEERLFRDVICQLPSGSSMIELGAYWAYYSLWFQQVIPNATTVMVELKLTHLNYGKRHFQINGFRGEFLQAGVGKESSNEGQLRIITIDEMLEIFSLEKVTILHSDIQGYELEMLQGAKKSLDKRAIDFFFISTHSDSLHDDCIEFLENAGYKILEQYRIHESWNPDGLIIAQSPNIPFISLKPTVKRS